MRHLTDDIVLSVKDAVRNLRYAIRSEAETPQAFAYAAAEAGQVAGRRREAPRRRNQMARFVDTLFSEVESGALALVAPDRLGKIASGFPHPVWAYFAPPNRIGDEEAERRFTRSYYQGAKALLRGFGLRNVLIYERAIGRARDTVIMRQRELAAAMWRRTPARSEAETTRLCAALSAALATARPIKEIDLTAGETLPHGLVAAPNAFCFIALGLATAIASTQEPSELPAGQAILESVTAVVDVRFERFQALLAVDSSGEALAQEFAEVLPLLP